MTRIAILWIVLLSPALFAAEWMQWRGPNHDGVSSETGLLDSWPEGGPKLLWKTDNLGGGYSNLSFADDRMFSMGDHDDGCYLQAFEQNGGKEIWRLKVGRAGASPRNGFPGPRCTPATDGKLVFAVGQFGDLVCADADTGRECWRLNVEAQLGGGVMLNRGDHGMHWNFAVSPIIDGERVVVPIGGKDGTVIAFQRSGEAFRLIWRSAEIPDAAPYSSVVPVNFGGVRQYLLFTAERLAGLDAETGKRLWSVDRPGKVAICSDPVFWRESDEVYYVMVSSAYDVGAHGFKIVARDGRFDAEEIFKAPRLQNHHGGIVRVGDHFYLITQRELTCVEPATGNVVWRDRSVGKGAIFAVDGKLIVRGEGGDGTIALVAATPEGYKEISRFDQPDRSDRNSWTYPLVRDGKLYIRDQGLLLCYDLRNHGLKP